MNWVISHGLEIITAVSFVISAAAIIAAWTPTPRDDAAIAWVRKIIDFLGQNYGNAKNK